MYIDAEQGAAEARSKPYLNTVQRALEDSNTVRRNKLLQSQVLCT
jgi:hypothetical protein